MSQQNQKKWPLVSLFIPCFNGMKFLPISLPSILALDYPNLELVVMDDKSTDQSVEYIQKNFPQFRVIQSPVNRGFATTVNQGFWITTGKYFFMVNQDTVYQPDYLKICVQKLEEDEQIGALCGKVYKYDFDKNLPTKIIDTVGQKLFTNRRVIDEGQGEQDQGQYEKSGEVFGVSGQNPLYRRAALESIAIPIKGREHPEVFDLDFFMYKEDVDVSWRLQLFGWKAWYQANAIAWHGRGTSAVKRLKNQEIVDNRGLLSKFQKYHSIKNRYLLMLKYEFPSHYLRHFPTIIWTEILYFGYNLVYDTANLKAYFAALSKFPAIWKKRQWIKKHRKINSQQFLHWFNKK